MAQLAVSAPAVLNDPGALESPVSGRQIAVEVLNARGRLLARSESLGAELLPTGGVTRAALRTRDRRERDGDDRWAAVRDLRGADRRRRRACGRRGGGGRVRHERHRPHNRTAGGAGGARRRGRGRSRCVRRGPVDAAQPAAAGAAGERRRGDRANRRSGATAARCGRRRRGRPADRSAQPDAVVAGVLARGRTAVPGRRLARAADAGDVAVGQRRLRGPARRRPRGARRPTPRRRAAGASGGLAAGARAGRRDGREVRAGQRRRAGAGGDRRRPATRVVAGPLAPATVRRRPGGAARAH